MTCEECGGERGVAAMERLDPRNLRPSRRFLCPKCGKASGYRPLDFGRSYGPRPPSGR